MRMSVGYTVGNLLLLALVTAPVVSMAEALTLRDTFFEKRSGWQESFAVVGSSEGGQRVYVIRRQYRRAFERQQAAVLRLRYITERLKTYDINAKHEKEFADVERIFVSTEEYLSQAPQMFEDALNTQTLQVLFGEHRAQVVVPLQDAHKVLARLTIELKDDE